MKRLLIVITAFVLLVAAAPSPVHARRVPVRRDGDPDDVQSVKRLDECGETSELRRSQGLPARGKPSVAGHIRRRIEVRFPRREFFLEK